AAALLQEQGYDVMGVSMLLWGDESFYGKEVVLNSKCCSVDEASLVAHQLGFTFQTLDFKNEFKEIVVDDFLKDYQSGKTPNPCVRCNKHIKFGALLDKARELGADYVATGHYVRIKRTADGLVKIFQGRDKSKDQSYFLCDLSQDQLKQIVFPLGDYHKHEVRRLAKEFGLRIHNKAESQEICFVPYKKHNLFLKRHLDLKKGPIKNLAGDVLSEHDGLPLYTLGQRKGIKIGGAGPYYVIGLDYESNTLYVSNDKQDPKLYSDQLIARNVNWISGQAPVAPLQITCSIRYGNYAEGVIEKKINETDYLVKFNNPVRAVTPGQSAVFYDGEELIGGGVIDRV
ncbi:MAG TPA: tRNA 2-thiouridine(34) synthase MnmA, partial [Patescibacteria group bacterium]